MPAERLQNGIEWRFSPGLVPYRQALAEMESRARAIREEGAPELVWLLEHPPLYTAGTSADPAELFNPQGFPVFEAGRGGRYTYHGPGQRVGYLLLDLDRRGRDIRRFVHSLEGWLIDSLARLFRESRSGTFPLLRHRTLRYWRVPGDQPCRVRCVGR